VRLPSPDPECGTGQAIGAPLGDPSEAFHDTSAGIALPADRTEDRTKAGVSFDTPGNLGERPNSLRAPSTVIGQKIHPDMPQHHEQFRSHPQPERIGSAARLDSRLHVTNIPGDRRATPTIDLVAASRTRRGPAAVGEDPLVVTRTRAAQVLTDHPGPKKGPEQGPGPS
jgi:hypothetical protein